MTYNEWRDELKSNLLCVPENEMRRVLDYYAEAYADRRDAGYSESEITAEFGAPYDAAQRILSESAVYPSDEMRGEEIGDIYTAPKNNTGQSEYSSQTFQPKTKDRSWIFVLLCVVFAIPLFGVVMAMVGVTVSFSVTPFALLIAGIGSIGEGVIELFSDTTLGAVNIGIGLAAFGLGLILMPIFLKIVKLMWKLFAKLFSCLKNLFSGKERK